MKNQFNQQSEKLNRRNFIFRTSFAGAGIALSALALQACNSNNNETSRTNSVSNNNMENKSKAANLKTRKLGSLEVTELGFGCMNVAWAYGPPTDKPKAIELFRAAYDNGVRFFDTAEVYRPFYSEEVAGEAFAPFRNDIVLATKIENKGV